MKKKYKILIITEVDHIYNVKNRLQKIGAIKYLKDPKPKDVLKIVSDYDIIFTNPNKSKVKIDNKILKKAKKLKIICTASTGTNHIDIKAAKNLNIKILSLKNEKKIINKISSTAELAFSMLLMSNRNLFAAINSVKKGQWDYTQFIGRQLNNITVGIIGYGRLGRFFGRYCKAFGSRVIAYDPHKKINDKKIIQVKRIDKLLKESDAISFHIHLDDNNYHLINKIWLNKMKKNIILINTSRGEIINEKDLLIFLNKNKKATYIADVISNEQSNKKDNNLFNLAKKSDQILLSPHIGGDDC